MAPLDRRMFENLHPGRRTVFELPLSDQDVVRIAVLDSAVEWDEVACAAMLVPTIAEDDWMYSSEGGQWQLLATAGVSRLIIVDRISELPGIGETRVRERASCWQCEDEALKTRLRSVVVALAPRICFRSGIPIVPFVVYTNNVIHRVVVEEVYSSLTGLMVVEDVALDAEVAESESFVVNDGGVSVETECAHGRSSAGCRNLDRVLYRRRLRFKRMPNLIQTEVPLVHSGAKIGGDTAIAKESVGANCNEIMCGLEIDHSFLVHKYLPPIVAGLVLAASCIEPCMERGERVKVLALGVGGGALPIFLQRHLGFHVQAVDVDSVVLDLAHRHFGLQNGVGMEVQVGDAVQFVGNLAMKGITEEARLNSKKSADASLKSQKGLHGRVISEDVQVPRSSTQNLVASSEECVHNVCQVNGSRSGFDNHRVHVIIVDVDEGDARCGLSSPPSSFLEHDFLSAARSLLHDGGLLAMNVVPNGAKFHCGVVSSLVSVFDDVYETAVEGDVSRVLFALPFKGAGVQFEGPLANLVKRFLDVRLISGIQKAHVKS